MTTDALVFEYAAVAGTAERRTALPFLIGLNHRTAPLDIRERMAVPEAKLAEITHALIIAQTAAYFVVSSADDVVDSIIDWLSRHGCTPRERLEPHLYIRRGGEAVTHLFRVASGLDSMVVGEPQIAGQVKKAFGAGALDPMLQQLFEQTMHVVKKVRSQTGIGEHAVSIPYAAVELAKKIFGELDGVRVLLLGAGEIGELTAEHFAKQSVEQIFVANKTYERAVELSARFGGSAVQINAFEDQL